MSTLFTQIIERKKPAHIVAEDSHHIAFLDIFPLAQGHTLVVPKKEVDYLFDLSDQDMAALMCFSKKVAKALKEAIPCRRIAVVVEGLEVPHAHVHLIPIQQAGDLCPKQPKGRASDEVLQGVARKVRQLLAS